MRIPVLEYPSFEADDVIGTLARRGVEQGMDVVIVSSDKDMLQLVNDHVRMINPMKDDMWYDAAETEKFMGVQPDQVADLLALKGDSVDNIPGAPGIGDKGARDLITRFGSVENAHRARGRSRAQDLSREPAKQSRPDPAEQEARDHPHRRAGGRATGVAGAARAGYGRSARAVSDARILEPAARSGAGRGGAASSAITSNSRRRPNWTRGCRRFPPMRPSRSPWAR